MHVICLNVTHAADNLYGAAVTITRGVGFSAVSDLDLNTLCILCNFRNTFGKSARSIAERRSQQFKDTVFFFRSQQFKATVFSSSEFNNLKILRVFSDLIAEIYKPSSKQHNCFC